MMLCGATGIAMKALHLEELVKITEIKDFFFLIQHKGMC